jgi:glutamate-ammonia-ligase adenylyltransferase
MGKLGGRELNVSSDIDLIFVYEDDGETTGGERAALSTQEYFTRLGRKLIGALAEVTEDGYVFRVDMRLRPNGDAGPLACGLGMLEEYFYVQGREWDQGAARVGERERSGATARDATRCARQAVYLPTLSRLRRDQRDSCAASADPAGSAAARVDASRQSR